MGIKRALVFGVGNNYFIHQKRLNMEYDVVGLIDNNYDSRKVSSVKPVSYCLEAEYDCIVITPSNYQDMYIQLINLGVSKPIIIDSLLHDSYGEYPKEILGYEYYGQHCDDLLIAAIFARIGIERPSYLDLGSNNPCGHNNTYRMYKCGCEGVSVDADSYWIDIYKNMRPNETHLCVGVSASEGEADYYSYGEGAGNNTISYDWTGIWSDELKGGISKIKITTLNRIIDDYFHGGFPDFLDCDIEGVDYKVLASYDFKSNGPKVICVEVLTEENAKFDNLLNKQGYFRFCRIGGNNIYVQKRYSMELLHCEC